MEIRELRASDADAIQEITRESLLESYDELDEETIETAAEQWYTTDAIEELLVEERALSLVAVNDEMYGYIQAEVFGNGTVIGDIHWLHVHPEKRGEGCGVQLLGEIVDRMENKNATLVRGRVVEVNEAGQTFYVEHGFEKTATDTTEIGDREYDELIYEKRLGQTDEEILERIEGDDGQELYVDYTGGETGTVAPLYPTYTDASKNEQYGWHCRNCDSTETAMSAEGRIQCGNCENTRKATRWDGSYM